MTRYITLRFDDTYSRPTATQPLLAFLAGLPELRRNEPALFASADGYPWLCLLATSCDVSGNYAANSLAPASVNIVEMACSDEPTAWYDDFARRIAAHLGWEAMDDEGRRLWPPGGWKKPRDE